MQKAAKCCCCQRTPGLFADNATVYKFSAELSHQCEIHRVFSSKLGHVTGMSLTTAVLPAGFWVFLEIPAETPLTIYTDYLVKFTLLDSSLTLEQSLFQCQASSCNGMSKGRVWILRPAGIVNHQG